MNRYNLVDCNKLSKMLITEDLWEKIKPMIEQSIIDLDNVKTIGVAKK